MDMWARYLQALEDLRRVRENTRREPLGVQARRRETLRLKPTPVI